MPQYLKGYRDFFGEKDVERVGKWLLSTLVCLPLWMPTLASGLEWLPTTAEAWSPDAYLWISVVLGGVWLLTGWLGDADEGMAGGVAFLVAFFGVLLGAVIIGGPVKKSLETGTPSWIARFAFVLLVGTHLFLISYCFLGGWRLFV